MTTENKIKYYEGRIPACGVFCGGCPMYLKDKTPCLGAEINQARCEKCKTFHLCCKEHHITYCFQCKIFPCYKFKRFAKNWLKYGQDMIENQLFLEKNGETQFQKFFNDKIVMTTENKIKYFENREDWRKWLTDNFETANEIWFVFPCKSSGKKSILYNDAVEEALCFGWIDSTVRALDKEHKIQRFTPRRLRSTYSQSNKERLAWLLENGLIHPKFEDEVRAVLADPFVFPVDIVARLREDPVVWANYERFSDSYKRIRVAYIEQARVSAEEFEKRLRNFIAKTRDGKIIAGYGGIEKYY